MTCEQSSALKVVGLQLQDDNSSDEEVGWWKEDHFNASNLIHWLSEEEIRERDKDKDGKLNSQEYFNGLLDLIKRYDDVYNFTYASDTSAEAPATNYSHNSTTATMATCQKMS
ncbi:hypothetical protein OPV22_025736 [Ensete ventricosum]|uniref:EF-hand domain-containing protein n=1 Tax=Ensete ventricosum TaxID=4639 RepID=A0AAV8QEL5_ENSVE|nr:hypothetical protein OPV22_025736 [Ensete ventricosum]